MTAVSWRDGAPELRRLIAAESGDPDRIPDVQTAWRAFQAFLAVPLDGLFDRWESDDVEADTLVVEFGASTASAGLPELLLARRFAIAAIEWHDGEPGEPSEEDEDGDDLDLDLADTVQIALTLIFPRGTPGDADDFWTAARSGAFDPADLAEAAELVTQLGSGPPLRSRVELMNCN